MDNNAARPLKLAPYPTLVGTPITGQLTRPPTTLVKAPSMPATLIMTAALVINSIWSNKRWIPATPTSYARSTRQP